MYDTISVWVTTIGRRGLAIKALALAACCMLLATPQRSHAGTIAFSDGIFNNGDWSSWFVGGTPTGFSGSTGHQELTGGFGGDEPYRRQSYSVDWPDVFSSDLMHVHNTAIFDPGAMGAITSLSGSFVYKDFTPANGNAAASWFAFVQDESIYRFTPGAGAISSWGGIGPANIANPLSWSKISGSGAAAPDFSESGSAIHFGYLTRFTFNNTGIETLGIDNWQYTITYEPSSSPVPEPSSIALLLVSGVCLVGYRRRRLMKQ